MYRENKIGVVIPTYKSMATIERVVSDIPEWVDQIIVVDDACPDGSGAHVQRVAREPRLTVIEHEQNLGVGGATVTGYLKALDLKCDIVVKIDSDGQMDSDLLHVFINPIAAGDVDYCKGNRFFRPESLSSTEYQAMPRALATLTRTPMSD